MDIYRYFHPHHNPRLFSTALRQQELSELEQAAAELRKALERARLRTERSPAGRILPSHFVDLIKAVRFIEDSLQTLCDAHEGDSTDVLTELVDERSGLRGWEAWTRIVMEQLASEAQGGESKNKGGSSVSSAVNFGSTASPTVVGATVGASGVGEQRKAEEGSALTRVKVLPG
ncbi:MAG: hypothetical protein KDD60_00845 [Bdellovibrionales bacterium]|nr:hypothetical protein [Bdellovibrionales bacterium]